jgi:hypothetical protein
MNNQEIVLCDEDLAGIHGGDIGTIVAGAIVGYVVSQIMKDAPAAVSAVGSAMSAANSALGPSGPYNPYSNPINCEYGGFY